jgi:lactobin A/cerein 7B family class IIb bacteriocin
MRIAVFTRSTQATSAVSEQAGEAIRSPLRDFDFHNQSVQGVYDMNQFSISQYQPAFACGSFQPGVLLPAPRELSEEEIDSVSGGIAPLIIAGARIAGVAFATTFGATLGAKTADLVWSGISSVWGEEEQACR